MARVFRQPYRGTDGKLRHVSRWHCEIRVDGRVRRLPAFTDAAASEEFGRRLQRLADAVTAGDPPDVEQRRWLAGLPQRIRRKLADWKLLDGAAVAAAKPLADHLAEYRAALVAKGTTERHARLVTSRAERLFGACGFRTLAAANSTKAQAWLADRRGDAEKPMSAQTANFYVQALRQFGRWLVREGRAAANPFDHLGTVNVRTDRRHDRRALSLEELQWLLAATATQGDFRGVPGAERALVYRLAVETGLRASELASLTRESFRLDATPPTVRVQAAYSKRRRDDELPLRDDTAAVLRAHLAGKLPQAAAFKLPRNCHLGRMLRHDLAAARAAWLNAAKADAAEYARRDAAEFLRYKTDAGFADFHALRHTFVSNLAASGVHPKTAQSLAHHSTISLTLDRYTHTVLSDLGDAVAALPSLEPLPQAAAATGTHGRDAAPEPAAGDLPRHLARHLPRQAAFSSIPMHTRALDTGSLSSAGRADGDDEKHTPNAGNTAFSASGSAWESNPPAARFTHGATVLKTAATTRCASTSGS